MGHNILTLALFFTVSHIPDVTALAVNTPFITICEAGYFCNALNLFKAYKCPKGHFCPRNSFSPTPCPLRTYSSKDGLKKKSDCTDCTPGKYCYGFGLTEPTGDCRPGFYCPSGSKYPNEKECPKGSYCPGRSGSPEHCPTGRFQPNTRETNGESCILCPPGSYCSRAGLPAPEGPCSAGYFCSEGTESPTPYDNICPAGTYCPEGASAPITCRAGTYCSRGGLPAPEGYCLAGYFCPEGSKNPAPADNICPAGTYCPMGSSNATTCPSETYQPAAGHADCFPCPEGYICPQGCYDPVKIPNVVYITPCPAGYYCRLDHLSSKKRKCPKGSYCPINSFSPKPCPVTTYMPGEGAAQLSSCKPCLPGMFCATLGLAAPTGYCHAGFYCPTHSRDPTELICPKGHYCPKGSAIPTPCPTETYGDEEGLQSRKDCKPCPRGKYCPPYIPDELCRSLCDKQTGKPKRKLLTQLIAKTTKPRG